MRHSLFTAAFLCAMLFSLAASAQTGFEDHLIAPQQYVWDHVVNTKANENTISMTIPAMRPVIDDIKIFSTDLNGDGKPDIVAAIDSFIYRQNGTCPVYIMISGGYDSYTQLGAPVRINTFDADALKTVHNGYRDLVLSGNTYIFNGKDYVAK